MNFINETNFKRSLIIIKSAGFISQKLIRSKYAIVFAYVIYLKLRNLGVNPVDIQSYVRRWYVYSFLTGRYSGSPEGAFDFDIKQISNKPFDEILKEVEAVEPSDGFWNIQLPQNLETSVVTSPHFTIFLAAQVKVQYKGFLSKDTLVSNLIMINGDVHHLFPKDYLKKNGLNDKNIYYQIANYVYMQSEINIKIGNKPPKEYFELIKRQITENNKQISSISTEVELLENFKMNCVPVEIMEMDVNDYKEFLSFRRKLIAQKIKDYYFGL